MKIYFCGSIRGGRSDLQLYQRIVHELHKYGSVLTEHVGSAELSDTDLVEDNIPQSPVLSSPPVLSPFSPVPCSSHRQVEAQDAFSCGSVKVCVQQSRESSRFQLSDKEEPPGLLYHQSQRDSDEEGEEGTTGGDRDIHDRDVDWLQQSDVVVAEVTQPSLGVGYELGRAVDMKKKKTLCLFRPSSGRTLSAMIRGAADGERFLVRDYSEDELEKILEEFFSSLK
ncbi:hypothetical protein CRENBAI_011986 [Crenichthys baileyi]|uniref:2'-deoxynucleoside 5'-phosphate N-hydrolase 1 n=1 Tax=Crenichthys baileyi TaxID=28760 RepID=A0AAV9SL77_9TELE